MEDKKQGWPADWNLELGTGVERPQTQSTATWRWTMLPWQHVGLNRSSECSHRVVKACSEHVTTVLRLLLNRCNNEERVRRRLVVPSGCPVVRRALMSVHQVCILARSFLLVSPLFFFSGACPELTD